jgi:hypothetical protein
MANHIALPMVKEEVLDCRVELNIMPFAFSNNEGIVHCEHVPRATPLNAADCVEVLSSLQDKVRRKLSEILCNGLILHHKVTGL